MFLTFERGDQAKPKGHAVLYFRDRADSSKLVATYVVVLPVSVDLVKYMPPFLAFQHGEASARELSAFAFPPLPEAAEGRERLELLAEVRDDDLIFGGEVGTKEASELLSRVNDAVQSYSQAYHAYVESEAPAEAPATEKTSPEPSVKEVLYGLMSERDRLAELSRLIGTLRFALDGSDQRMAQETKDEAQMLAKYLPQHYKVDQLLEAASDPSRGGADLAQLYLARCYKLLDEDFNGVREMEEQIQQARLRRR
ncbi:MAG: hypothetical protein HYY31_06070 [Chloroflexi bacterium]|nr:hypothetical protein [Chloroflexota bacterium]